MIIKNTTIQSHPQHGGCNLDLTHKLKSLIVSQTKSNFIKIEEVEGAGYLLRKEYKDLVVLQSGTS